MRRVKTKYLIQIPRQAAAARSFFAAKEFSQFVAAATDFFSRVCYHICVMRTLVRCDGSFRGPRRRRSEMTAEGNAALVLFREAEKGMIFGIVDFFVNCCSCDNIILPDVIE